MIPPGLEGRFPVTLADIPQFPAIEAALPQLEKGGRWRPPECTARHKVRSSVAGSGYGMFVPGSEFFPSRIPDFFHPGSASKNLSILTPKMFLNSRKYDPGCSSRIRILIFAHPGSRIQGSKRPRIRIRNTGERDACSTRIRIFMPDPDPQRIALNHEFSKMPSSLKFSKCAKKTGCNLCLYIICNPMASVSTYVDEKKMKILFKISIGIKMRSQIRIRLKLFRSPTSAKGRL
jgi:hypothetical protein